MNESQTHLNDSQVHNNAEYKRALTWLHSCQTQTPSVEEVVRLIEEIRYEHDDEAPELRSDW